MLPYKGSHGRRPQLDLLLHLGLLDAVGFRHAPHRRTERQQVVLLGLRRLPVLIVSEPLKAFWILLGTS